MSGTGDVSRGSIANNVVGALLGRHLTDAILPEPFRAADWLAIKARKQYLFWLRTELVCLVLAALTAALAFVSVARITIGPFTVRLPTPTGAVRVSIHELAVTGVISAAFGFLAVASRLYRVQAHFDATWLEARAIAEWVRSLAWRYAVGGHPFALGGDEVAQRALFLQHLHGAFGDVTRQFAIKSFTSEQESTKALQALRVAPLAARQEAYRSQRIADREHWYVVSARNEARRARSWHWVLLIIEFGGIIGSVLLATGVTPFNIQGVLGVVAGAGIAWSQARRYREHTAAYRIKSRDLAEIRMAINTQTSESTWAAFVDEAETVCLAADPGWQATRGAFTHEPGIGHGGETPPPVLPGRPVYRQPEPVIYSAVHPEAVAQDVWSPLLVFISQDTASALDAVREEAQQVLARYRDQAFRSVVAPETSVLWRGTSVTITPNLPGFQFNPPTLTVTWEKDVQRHEFDMRVVSAQPGFSANGYVNILVGPLLCARIPLSVRVNQTGERAERLNRNVFAHARPTLKVFPSYSRKDKDVVGMFREFSRWRGDTFLQDIVTFRPGTEWRSEVKHFVDQADVFELFWSQNAASSDNVTEEWQYAMARRSQHAPNFIQPVFWSPVPYVPIPPALAGIEFFQVNLPNVSSD